tara:strand:- start:6888 stop:7835 length:948 start_codon:yes stop_codon:yes gene_type:complete
MGVFGLNRYLRNNCKNALNETNMKELKGKTIAVDISIYLYKFKGFDCLISEMYLMFRLFKDNEITPIFIFDGKPKADKKELLKHRREEKLKNIALYDEIQLKVETEDIILQNSMKLKIKRLKQQCVCMTAIDIAEVKKLMVAFGFTFYVHTTEADQLCAHMVKEEKAFACLSEDMDLLMYGCPRVLRYMNLRNHTFKMYNLKSILKDLNIDLINFRIICTLAGTDYNFNNTNNSCNIDYYFAKFYEYRNTDFNTSFLDWCLKYKLVINIAEVNRVICIFEEECIFEETTNLSIYSKHSVRDILKSDGFIFPLTSI